MSNLSSFEPKQQDFLCPATHCHGLFCIGLYLIWDNGGFVVGIFPNQWHSFIEIPFQCIHRLYTLHTRAKALVSKCHRDPFRWKGVSHYPQSFPKVSQLLPLVWGNAVRPSLEGPLVSLHALTPLKAVWGHRQPLLIVVKGCFVTVLAAVEGKQLPIQ